MGDALTPSALGTKARQYTWARLRGEPPKPRQTAVDKGGKGQSPVSADPREAGGWGRCRRPTISTRSACPDDLRVRRPP